MVGCWRGCLSEAWCRFAYGPQLMPLSLTVSSFSKIQIGFTVMVLAHPGSSRQNPESRKRVAVIVVVLTCISTQILNKFMHELHNVFVVCRFPLFVALCDHHSLTLETDIQTDIIG